MRHCLKRPGTKAPPGPQQTRVQQPASSRGTPLQTERGNGLEEERAFVTELGSDNPRLAPKLVAHDPGELFYKREQDPRRSFRAPAPLLPALQRSSGDANAASEFGRRQSRALVDCGHIQLRHVDMMNPRARLVTFGVGKSPVEALFDAWRVVGLVTFYKDRFPNASKAR